MVSTIAGGSSFEIGTGAWEDAPRVDLVCRSFGDAVDIFWRIFMPTYLVSVHYRWAEHSVQDSLLSIVLKFRRRQLRGTSIWFIFFIFVDLVHI